MGSPRLKKFRLSLILTTTAGSNPRSALVRTLGFFAIILTLFPLDAMAASPVVVGRDRIVVRKAIPFAAGRADIPKSSASLLKELARALNENPQFTKVRIEGHTDSSGRADQNRKLSQRRADAVRAELVRYGVSDTRLIARGFGSTDPLESNASKSGRKKNRRVVFEVLQVGGKKVERPPLAKVSAKRNAVTSRAPLESDWHKADVGEGLRRSWRVRTELDSGAGITFRDASRIDMREETLVIIFGASESKARKKPMRAALESGTLTAWLEDAQGKDTGLLVETPSGDAELEGGKTTVRLANADGKRSSAFSNHTGKPARVYGKKKSGSRFGRATKVKSGYGSRVKAGKRPEKPRKLPNPPVLTLDSPVVIGTAGSGATVLGGWAMESDGAKKARTIKLVTIELASKDRANEAPVRVTVAGTAAGLMAHKFRIENLAPGGYTLRGSVVDDIGLESGLSDAIDVQVARLGRDDSASKGASKSTLFRAGDRLVAPNGFRCAIGQTPFDDSKALVVLQTSTSARCERTKEGAGGQAVVVPLRVAKAATLAFNAPKLAVGSPATVVIQSDQPIDASFGVTAVGATVSDVDTTQDAAGRRTFTLNVQPGTDRVKLSLERRGVRLGGQAFAVDRDKIPPTISNVVVRRVEADPTKIEVRARVVDDRSGVREVSVQISGTDTLARNAMSRGEEPGAFVATIDAPPPTSPQSITVSSIDAALNGPTVASHPVPPDTSGVSAWWLAVPIGIAVPVIVGGLVLIGDAAAFDFTGGPIVGRFVDDQLGRNDDAPVLAVAEGATGVALVVVGLTTVAASIAIASGLASSEADPVAEE